MAVRERMVHEFFNRIDHQLAVRVAEGIGVDPPTVGQDKAVTKLVPEVGVEARKRTDAIATRKIAILAADGYDHASLLAVRKALEAQGPRCEVVAKNQGRLRAAGGAKGRPPAPRPRAGAPKAAPPLTQRRTAAARACARTSARRRG